MCEALTFTYMLKVVRHEMLEKMSIDEEEIVNEHFEYLKRGLAGRKLILAGRCLDGEFGIVVFRAKSKEEAEEFMKNDPAVKNGIMTAQLYPFRVALIEKS